MTSAYIANDSNARTADAQKSSTISSMLSFTAISILYSQQLHGHKQMVEHGKQTACTDQHHYDFYSRFLNSFHQLIISWDKIRDTKNIYMQGILIIIIVNVSAINNSLR